MKQILQNESVVQALLAQHQYILENKHLSRNIIGKKNIINTPEPEKTIWEIIIDLISGKGKNKRLLDWVKDNSFN